MLVLGTLLYTNALNVPGVLLNATGNSIFNAALMLALPEENRGAILGFIVAASVGGCPCLR